MVKSLELYFLTLIRAERTQWKQFTSLELDYAIFLMLASRSIVCFAHQLNGGTYQNLMILASYYPDVR